MCIDLATLPVYYNVVTRLCDSAGTALITRYERLPDTPYAMQARVAAVEAMYAGRTVPVTVTIESQIDWDKIAPDVQAQLFLA